MKTRFSTLDICAILSEINERAIGMRLANVYDINNKTYLFKLAKTDEKLILLVESGIRIHLSEFDWPKNPMPSGFSTKLRKHLRGRRLVSAVQLGIDRIVDLQFGSNEAAYHVIIELYDRGNIALTDHEYTILNLLRFRKDPILKMPSTETEENEDVRIAVHERYPVHAARQEEAFISQERLLEVLMAAKHGSVVKRTLNPVLPYGAPCLDHCLLVAGFSVNAKIGVDFSPEHDTTKLHCSLEEAEEYLQKAKASSQKGYVIKKREKKSDGELLTNVEFQPFLFEQYKSLTFEEFPSFNKAVDEFFGSLESQKNDLKALQRERAALKKLENVRRDHEARISGLQKEQEEDKMKAALIEANLEVVDQAILIVCSAIANQVDWNELKALVHTAQAKGDRVALLIKSLKLETNSMIMALSEPNYDYDYDDDSDSDFLSDSDDEKAPTKTAPKSHKIEIDLSMSAYANAQRYYNMKRQAMKKEQRTADASAKAFKSAEKKTKQSLKEAAAVQNIQKARKIFWFEKFHWFVSSENYLVLGGRDAQQNELLVKKYLNSGDVYVHADLHGATSCIVKNPAGSPVPPKTLNEAGTMAICHSAAWDAKVVTSAWWVRHDQVSKTAPSGEYLTTGSFLIRGKKNYLPPSYLVYGFGFLFKVDETCIWKHKDERRVRAVEDDLSTVTDDLEEVELPNDDEEDEDNAIPGTEPTVADNKPTGQDLASVATGDANVIATTNRSPQNEIDSEVMKDVADGATSTHHLERFENNGATDASVKATQFPVADVTTSNDVVTGNAGKGSKATDVVTEDAEPVGDSRLVKVPKDEMSSNPEEAASSTTVASMPFEYPDTVVKMQYNMEDKYQLTSYGDEDQNSDKEFVYLGDNEPVPVSREKASADQGKARLSAKQRREQRKIKKDQFGEVDVTSSSRKGSKPRNQDFKEPEEPPTTKRGKKNKLKKIKEKYKDQDEEERQMKMEILQSAKGPKEKKVKNKGSDVKGKKQPQGPKTSQKPRAANVDTKPTPQETATDAKIIKEVTAANQENTAVSVNAAADSDEEREEVLKEEHLSLQPVVDILDTLTGSPVTDDVLLFAIPVCAPYNSMQNYKFKVKLTPGTGKKGKAAKTAINMFLASRETIQQEKDHLRSVKDHDLSRNMPGKVKVSAPNLQKQKYKKR